MNLGHSLSHKTQPAGHNVTTSPLFRRRLGIIPTATPTEGCQQVQYPKLENDILRNRITEPARVTSQKNSLLVKFAKPLGRAMRHVVSIFRPETLLRWKYAFHGAYPDGSRVNSSSSFGYQGVCECGSPNTVDGADDR